MTAMPNPFAGGDGLVQVRRRHAARRSTTTPATWRRSWPGPADPRLEERKRLGLLVMVYLLITAVLLYFAKRRIWSKAH